MEQSRTQALLIGVVTLLSLLAFVRPLRAQVEPSEYRVTIAEAVSEFQAEHWAEAKALFERAHRLNPSARTMRGLGLVALELHQYVAAVDYLAKALADSRNPLNQEQRDEAMVQLASAKRFVARFIIELSPENAVIAVDGKPVTLRRGELRLDAGQRELTVSAPGYRTERTQLAVQGGTQQQLTFRLSSLSQAGAAVANTTTTAKSGRRARRMGLGVTALGLGAGALMTAGILSIQRQGEGERLRQEGSTEITPAYHQYLRLWQDRRPLPYVLSGVGSAITMTGVLGLALSSERDATPWWVSTLSGAAGVGLASWGVINIVQGGACDGAEVERHLCSTRQEARDRGMLLLLSAAPLLALPIAQLARLASWSLHGDARVSLLPEIDPLGQALLMVVDIAEERKVGRWIASLAP